MLMLILLNFYFVETLGITYIKIDILPRTKANRHIKPVALNQGSADIL